MSMIRVGHSVSVSCNLLEGVLHLVPLQFTYVCSLDQNGNVCLLLLSILRVRFLPASLLSRTTPNARLGVCVAVFGRSWMKRIHMTWTSLCLLICWRIAVFVNRRPDRALDGQDVTTSETRYEKGTLSQIEENRQTGLVDYLTTLDVLESSAQVDHSVFDYLELVPLKAHLQGGAGGSF